MAQELPQHVPAFELTSLNNKFKSLWLAGVESKLVFKSRAGQAWGRLEVHLGEHPGKQEQGQSRRNESPSKKRRRERREAARADLGVENSDAVAEKADTSVIIETANGVKDATSEKEVVTLAENTSTFSVADQASETVAELKSRNERLMEELRNQNVTVEKLTEKVNILSGENLEL